MTSFTDNPEDNIKEIQNSLNQILLNNIELIDDSINNLIDTKEGLYPSKEISGCKIIFEMWLKATGVENVVNINQAFDTLIKEGYKVDLEEEQLKHILNGKEVIYQEKER